MEGHLAPNPETRTAARVAGFVQEFSPRSAKSFKRKDVARCPVTVTIVTDVREEKWEHEYCCTDASLCIEHRSRVGLPFFNLAPRRHRMQEVYHAT